MPTIIRKQQLAPGVTLLEFEARDLSMAAHAGQFVIIRVNETGERFPLTIYDFDRRKGTVTVVCQAVGVSTKKLSALNVGDSILDVAGPLGHAVRTNGIGRVICIGGGVGTAEAYPIAKAMKEAGNSVTAIIGARNKDLVICENELRAVCTNVHVTTDDGSHGRQGLVTDVLKDLLNKNTYDLVFAIGPLIMMKMVSRLTKEMNVRTLVSLNSIMIDGTGMCGGCRIKYNGEAKFTCVDGPEFDGHLIDYDEVMLRQGRFKDKEKAALNHYEGQCRIGLH